MLPKFSLQKNKNQLEDGLTSVSGNADDLLSAIKNGKFALLLAAKLKEGKNQRQYLCKRPSKKSATEHLPRGIGKRGDGGPNPLKPRITAGPE